MAHVLDPRVKRFLANHAVSKREAIESDVAEHRQQTPAERWRILELLSSTMDWLRVRPAEERARVLEWRDPPHPSYRELLERLRQR